MTNAVSIAQSGSNNQTMRNRIINGAMTIDQRNAGASLTVNAAAAFFPVDRFFGYGQATDGVFTIQQSTAAPAGFVNSIIATITTADASIGSTQEYGISQNIEGLNVADLAWGTANAQPVTLSFWVRSSVTGTFGGSLSNSGYGRAYAYSYTISAANTWEYKTITIAGDTTGTWLTNTGAGIRVRWNLGTGSSYLGTANVWSGSFANAPTGSVQLISTLGATFQITGVQLEEGTAASPFENRLIGTELQLCQRYFKLMPALQGNFVQGLNVFIAGAADSAINMRATPTGTLVNGTNGIHVSNVSNYNITSLNDINNNYYRVNTNTNPGSNVPGHYNLGAVTLSAEL
jgi:hypothetical protein